MTELGFEEKVESNHEFIWVKKNLCLELHKRLIPSYNVDYYSYFGDGWSLAKRQSGTRYVMSAEDQMIYLFVHFFKHYRDAGIGIKHIMDLWVYRNNNPEMDEEYVTAELEKLKEFYGNVLDTLAVRFDGAEANEKTEMITNVIFDSGVYGTHAAHVMSDAVKRSVKDGSSRKVKWNKFWNSVFLPYSDMKKSILF